MSIDIPGHHFESSNFVSLLTRKLESFPELKRGKRQIEFLETVALSDIHIVREVIESCKKWVWDLPSMISEQFIRP